jgi:hypothetical protein
MALMPDDEPELLPPRRSFLLMSILPALSANECPRTRPGLPSLLNSLRSRQTMASFLGIVAGMLGRVPGVLQLGQPAPASRHGRD